MAGLIFDRYGDESFKFAAVDADQTQKTATRDWPLHAKGRLGDRRSDGTTILPEANYTLGLTLKGNTVSVTLNDPVNGGYQAIGSEIFYASTVDGNFGLFARDGAASFDNLEIKTNDRAFSDALVAADGEVLSADHTPVLTPEELAPVVASAIAYWRVLGHDVSAIEGINVEISDLPGTLLGLVKEDTVYIDVNAAGHGWFVDPTPLTAEEFNLDGTGSLTAIAGGDADGRIDLMTVVTHELGHILGIVHDETALMDSSLQAGTRELSTEVTESAAGEVVENLDSYNILVTSATDWSEPSVSKSAQQNMPDSVNSNGTIGNSQPTVQALETLVFDEVSGEFIEIENAKAETTSTTMSTPTDETVDNQNDWVVYMDIASDGASALSDPANPDGNSGAIDWDASSEEVNDLLPPPPPGRSGMKHAKGNGAN